MGEHKDDEKDLDHTAPIASISFGAQRDFILRHQSVRGKQKTSNIPTGTRLGLG